MTEIKQACELPMCAACNRPLDVTKYPDYRFDIFRMLHPECHPYSEDIKDYILSGYKIDNISCCYKCLIVYPRDEGLFDGICDDCISEKEYKPPKLERETSMSFYDNVYTGYHADFEQ